MIEISVIIPCFNSFSLMKNCLQSLENQTFKNFEVIIVDDCSTDNTYEMLIRYMELSMLNLKVLRQIKNLGPGAARNLAIENAQGSYLAFCDSDDWYEDDYLEKMYNSCKMNEADIAICNYKKVFQNNFVEVNYIKENKLKNNKRNIITNSKTSLCLILIKRSIFTFKIPEIYNGEDMAIIPLLMTKANKIVCIEDCLYNYRIHNSLSLKNDKSIFFSIKKAYKYICDNWEIDGYDEELSFLGVKFILYGALLNGIRANIEKNIILNDIKLFEIQFPKWYKNTHIKNMQFRYRMFLFFVRFKLFFLMQLYVKIHSQQSHY
ncbi:MAG TPA: glycosyltransferase family 2 protein [Candidatus Erysipelatoclostridium merdavium]|uniref:Glycosyltransferase family 2 protein n=1 Tax=Candidatus Erysipelatoclostridium merdavium TaxID=2838566 RepID=A0A9D2BMC7_9FIRM|nr:glycosyltransferase family 2 protein [Candidatus Erysipelatoclostridium merdavium]